MWVSGKIDSLLTRAIPEHFRDEQLIIKQYIQARLTLLHLIVFCCFVYFDQDRTLLSTRFFNSE